MDGSSWIGRAAPAKRGALSDIAGLVRLWRERARQRRQLATLDERALRDIGITRLDQRRECAKPFWRP